MGYTFKEGDKVFVENNIRKFMSVVSKITPKGFVKVSNTLYTPEGYERGSSWCSSTIRPVTKDEYIEYTRNNFISAVRQKMSQVQTLSFEQAQQINSILSLNVKEEGVDME